MKKSERLFEIFVEAVVNAATITVIIGLIYVGLHFILWATR